MCRTLIVILWFDFRCLRNRNPFAWNTPGSSGSNNFPHEPRIQIEFADCLGFRFSVPYRFGPCSSSHCGRATRSSVLSIDKSQRRLAQRVYTSGSFRCSAPFVVFVVKLFACRTRFLSFSWFSVAFQTVSWLDFDCFSMADSLARRTKVYFTIVAFVDLFFSTKSWFRFVFASALGSIRTCLLFVRRAFHFEYEYEFIEITLNYVSRLSLAERNPLKINSK